MLVAHEKWKISLHVLCARYRIAGVNEHELIPFQTVLCSTMVDPERWRKVAGDGESRKAMVTR